MVKECDICWHVRYETTLLASLLQPLPIPQQAWSKIPIDFIEGLPKSQGKEVILVIVDRFTKFGHFISMSHLYTVAKVAKIFLNNIFKLYGLRKFIVFYRGLVFLSLFLKSLFTL